ncbi:hypothetical protein [Citrifermentans bremense]|uniref:hypothetical protein n=1 Tax=Citrifermentans bremense TaxID=60035 RepID=UPI000687737D|nr:hypothetical protein [Citrifermentans bremense]
MEEQDRQFIEALFARQGEHFQRELRATSEHFKQELRATSEHFQQELRRNSDQFQQALAATTEEFKQHVTLVVEVGDHKVSIIAEGHHAIDSDRVVSTQSRHRRAPWSVQGEGKCLIPFIPEANRFTPSRKGAKKG